MAVVPTRYVRCGRSRRRVRGRSARGAHPDDGARDNETHDRSDLVGDRLERPETSVLCGQGSQPAIRKRYEESEDSVAYCRRRSLVVPVGKHEKR